MSAQSGSVANSGSKKSEVICSWPLIGELISTIAVLARVSLSKSWMGIAIFAPLLWGLLPLGYAVLNADADISSQRELTVLVRLSLATVGTFALLLLAATVEVFCFGLKTVWRTFTSMARCLCSWKVWCGLFFFLPLGYFAARILEMKWLLGFGNAESDLTTNAASALQAFGYFMGLLLVVAFPRKIRRNVSIVELLVWIVTVILVMAGGILKLMSHTTDNVWGQVWQVLCIAFVVALCCWAYTKAKGTGKVVCRDEKLATQHPYWVPLSSACVMNIVMCGVAAFATWVWMHMQFRPLGWISDLTAVSNGQVVSIWNFFKREYLAGSEVCLQARAFWLIVGIVLLGTVLAPVLQLFGVAKHDADMAQRSLSRYGVSGGDWLVVCGGFEPMFVVLVAACIPAQYADTFKLPTFVSYWPVVMCFLLVLAIALLRIVRIWSEKGSALRNAIYVAERGSTHADLSAVDAVRLRTRAKKLALLKFYDKRDHLRGKPLSIGKIISLKDLQEEGAVKRAIAANPSFLNAYVVPIIGGDDYFTQDDPFTSDVLKAQFSWLRRCVPEIDEISSCSYELKPYCANGEWKKLKARACGNVKSATPFVVFCKDESKVKLMYTMWLGLLVELHDIVSKCQVSQHIKKMMFDFQPKE